MTNEEYVTTFYINGKKVDVGLDDYGQCYFFEWEENGEKKEICLGTYEDDYVENAFYIFDPVYRHISNREYWEDFTESEKELFNVYAQMIKEIYRDMT